MTISFTNQEVEKVLTMDVCLEVMEEAYREEAEGRAINQLRHDTRVPIKGPKGEDWEYELKTMVGIVPKFDIAAVRVMSSMHDRPIIGGVARATDVPLAPGGALVGIIQLYRISTTEPLAFFPDAVLQRQRVGVANGIGAKYLARKDAKVMGLYGSGWQSRSQVEAMCRVRLLQKIKVFSPNRDHRVRFAEEMTERVGVEIVPVDSPEAVMKGSDIVASATNSMGPVILGKWVEEGMFLTDVKHELDDEAISKVDLTVIHQRQRFEQRIMDKSEQQYGRLRHMWPAPDEKFPLLEDVVAGKVKGRKDERQIIHFSNNGGLGIQFVACGAKLYDLARKEGLGREIPTDWLTQVVKMHGIS
jgi:ornithine cyclodeaminase/alanine dehydrogenase-like protein (mu-crystallin family)